MRIISGKIKYIILILLIGISCRGNPSYKQPQSTKSLQNINRLKAGMSKEQVISIIGKSALTISTSDKKIEILHYPKDVKETKSIREDLIPIIFENGILAGWGWDFLDSNIEKYKIRFLQDSNNLGS